MSCFRKLFFCMCDDASREPDDAILPPADVYTSSTEYMKVEGDNAAVFMAQPISSAARKGTPHRLASAAKLATPVPNDENYNQQNVSPGYYSTPDFYSPGLRPSEGFQSPSLGFGM